jgi:hypothetical protein
VKGAGTAYGLWKVGFTPRSNPRIKYRHAPRVGGIIYPVIDHPPRREMIARLRAGRIGPDR